MNSIIVCEVCMEVAVKYKCPGCQMQTCSLPCVKQHKIDNKCDGTRNKTDFVPISGFTDLNLLSDYRFLEEAGRKADSANRDNFKNQTRSNFMRNKLKKHCKTLNICLLSMPFHMTRRKQNHSRIQRDTMTITWTVEWIFPETSSKFTETASDETTIEQLLTRFIDPQLSDPMRRQILKPYVKAGINNVKVFLKVEGSNPERYYEMAKDQGLSGNLENKVIIEFPTLYVVMPEQTEGYTLLEEGEEPPSETFCEMIVANQRANTYHHSHNYGNNPGYKRHQNYRNGRGGYYGPKRPKVDRCDSEQLNLPKTQI